MLSSLLLLLTAPGAPAIAAPPQCPWESAPYTVLDTGGAQQDFPLNASQWIVDYYDTGTFDLEESSGATVAVDESRTSYMTSGSLVRIEPRALAPFTTYRLRVDGRSRLPEFMTGTSTDTTPPATPNVTNTLPNTDAYTICQAAGLIIWIERPQDDTLFWLVEDDDGNLIGVGAPIIVPYNGVFIPTVPDAQLSFTVVAVDVAGNRSDATPRLTGKSGGIPLLPGRPPFDPNNPNNPNGLPDGTRNSGCDCTAEHAASGAPWWLVLFGFAFIRARRR